MCFRNALKSFLLSAFCLFALPLAAAPLRYEPAVVELKGTVALEEHFGPPGFGEDPKTDSRELIAVLVLDEPVSVEGDRGDTLNRTSYSRVQRVQLVRTAADPPFSRYQGVRVVVSGTLFERHTGHHHADVLVAVQSIAVRP